jgi:methanogenic corrinoid protein MtbC1
MTNGLYDLLSQGQLTAAKKSMDETSRAKKALEDEVAVHLDSVSRLTEANDILSQRALTLADEMEQEKKTMQVKLEREIDTLRKQLKASEDRVDDERAR